MTVAVLCGGKGTRLAPLTDHLPKYLVDVNGAPFARHQLALLRRHGYTDIVLLIGHLGEMIREALGDGSNFGMSIRYSDDGDDALGTDEAIRKALPLLGDEFFVLYGDSYLECYYRSIERIFHKSKGDALFTTYNGVDYGLRAFRAFPPKAIWTYEMLKPFYEIGSHAGLESLRAHLVP